MESDEVRPDVLDAPPLELEQQPSARAIGLTIARFESTTEGAGRDGGEEKGGCRGDNETSGVLQRASAPPLQMLISAGDGFAAGPSIVAPAHCNLARALPAVPTPGARGVDGGGEDAVGGAAQASSDYGADDEDTSDVMDGVRRALSLHFDGAFCSGRELSPPRARARRGAAGEERGGEGGDTRVQDDMHGVGLVLARLQDDQRQSAAGRSAAHESSTEGRT